MPHIVDSPPLLAAWLAGQLTPERIAHSQQVAATASELAVRFGADLERARLAGLVHDAARCLDATQLLKAATDSGIVVSSVERQAPVALLHGPVAAAFLPSAIGLTDAGILRAVAVHTTGAAPMSLLDRIIYLADYIEPGRPYAGAARARQAAQTSLEQALRIAFDESLSYLIAHGDAIHPLTIAARNALLLGEL